MNKHGLAGALAPTQMPQAAPMGQQQGIQQMQHLLQIISGVKDQKTYDAAKQQIKSMGGAKAELPKKYDAKIIGQFKNALGQALSKLSGAQQQQAPMPQQAPPSQPAGLGQALQSNAPAPLQR